MPLAVRGSAGGYGFETLTRLPTLERAGEKRISAAIADCMNEIEAYLSSVKVVYVDNAA